MKRFKLKDFLKVFLFLMVIQFIIGLVDIILSQANNELSSITSIIITICSFPVSLINRNLPFFISDNLFMVGLYWIINVIIQTVFVYLILVVLKKMRDSK